jgi:hypothetical protein
VGVSDVLSPLMSKKSVWKSVCTPSRNPLNMSCYLFFNEEALWKFYNSGEALAGKKLI